MSLSRNTSSSKKFTDKFFSILSDDYPDFLSDYSDVAEIRRLSGTSVSCGCNYTNLFDLNFLYSNFDHSIGVALIIWHFTHDKKATLAGLFHDIANPTFKHCIDFMNGDHIKQESTEARTAEIIKTSKEITALLNRDGIKLDDVSDYKIYPIADNDTPKLSADRLEYTLVYGFFWKPIWSLDDISEIYNDIEIMQNEAELPEIGFKNIKIAEKFIDGACQLWPTWADSKDKLTMQFIADIVARIHKMGLISINDLYYLSEKDVIDIIKNCPDKGISLAWRKFEKSTSVYESDEEVIDRYCRSIKSKQRYIVPLVLTKNGSIRINKISSTANKQIEDYKKIKTAKFAYFDFNF